MPEKKAHAIKLRAINHFRCSCGFSWWAECEGASLARKLDYQLEEMIDEMIRLHIEGKI